MGLWQDILARFSIAGTALMKPFRPADPDSSAGFTIAFVALSAKLAKADGSISIDEVRAFRRVVSFRESDRAAVARVFDLCGQETKGYEFYARQLGRRLCHSVHADRVRENIIDGLFHVASANGAPAPAQIFFIDTVSSLIGMAPEAYAALRARHAVDEWDPYAVLGVSREDDEEVVRVRWKQKIRENHPDLLYAAGLPEEALRLAHSRLVDLNKAYEDIRAVLQQHVPSPACL